MAQSLMRTDRPAAGYISYGDQEINQISTERLTRNVSYAGPEPILFDGTILQNINYGLRRKPPEEDTADLTPARLTEIEEAKASGNSPASAHDIWTDFDMAGVENWREMRNWLQEMMVAIGSRRMVFELGLKDYFDPTDMPTVIEEKFIETRNDLTHQWHSQQLDHYVKRFDINSYHPHLSVLENIGFGLIKSEDEVPLIRALTGNDEFVRILQQQNLYKPLRDAGEQVSKNIIEELCEVGPEGQLKPHLSQYDSECIRDQLTQCIGRPDYLPACEFLLEMALKVRIVDSGEEHIHADLQKQIVELRHWLIEQDKQKILTELEPLNENRINARLSVMENLVWGIEVSPNHNGNHGELVEIVEQALIANDAESLVLITIGLSPVGIRGERLPLAAKLNIQLLRCLVKRPKILILHDALEHKTPDEQLEMLEGIRHLMPELTIILLRSGTVYTPLHSRNFRIDNEGLVALN
ncbi:hypothetical protein [Aliamphritea spongicola]|nr:hypothetical protein [Aliamphritea spongicola]